MGTRSLTYVHDSSYGKNTVVAAIYRQMDGYPSGMGKDLATFLAPYRVCNGYGAKDQDMEHHWANGAGCLAAQLVAHLKDGIGNIYLSSAKLKQDAGQEYEYHVYAQEGKIELEIVELGMKFFGEKINYKRKPMFKGTPAQVLEWIKKQGKK